MTPQEEDQAEAETLPSSSSSAGRPPSRCSALGLSRRTTANNAMTSQVVPHGVTVQPRVWEDVFGVVAVPQVTWRRSRPIRRWREPEGARGRRRRGTWRRSARSAG